MTVYVVQKQMRFDHTSGELVPRFDTIHEAAKWGEIQYLLSPSAHPFQPDNIITELREKLKDYSKHDYLLLIGNPAIIGMVTAIAANNTNGEVKLLQWSGRDGDYVEIKVGLF